MSQSTTARDVLAHHVALAARLRDPGPEVLSRFASLMGDGAVRQFYPFHLLPPGQAVPLFARTVALDLTDARTYQVVTDMARLTEELYAHEYNRFTVAEEAELPHPYGFAWLDEPWGEVRALSWAIVPMAEHKHGGIRLVAWREAEDGELEFASCEVAAFGQPVTGPVPQFAFVLWSLFHLDITDADGHVELTAQAKHQAGGILTSPDLRVVRLLRPAHQGTAHAPHHVDWSHCWLVRGHVRHYQQVIKHGPNKGRDAIWIKPHIKGPDGLPLKVTDVVYRLER